MSLDKRAKQKEYKRAVSSPIFLLAYVIYVHQNLTSMVLSTETP